jgi:hypothetical protein
VQINVARTVAAPPSVAFATLADIMHWPEMIGSVTSIELLTSGPIRVGTRLRGRRIIFGHDAAEEMEIVEIERPRRLRLAAQNDHLHYERDHIIDAIQSGSRLTLILRPKPGTDAGRALQSFIAPFMDINLRGELEQDLIDLATAIAARSSKKSSAVGRV